MKKKQEGHDDAEEDDGRVAPLPAKEDTSGEGASSASPDTALIISQNRDQLADIGSLATAVLAPTSLTMSKMMMESQMSVCGSSNEQSLASNDGGKSPTAQDDASLA